MTDADLLTTAEVAAALGIKPSRVRQLSRSDRLGQLFAGRLVFSPADMARLRERKTRPGPDKGFWLARENARQNT